MKKPYGTHTDLVQEVLDWAYGSGPLAARGPAVITPELVIVTDLSRACQIANLGESDGLPDSPSSPWRHLLGHFRGQSYYAAVADPFRPIVDEALEDFYSRQVSLCPADVNRADYEEVVEWAQADLSAIAVHRACFGMVSGHFFEALFALYREGLWPCGFQDFVPDPGNAWPTPGRFIAWRHACAEDREPAAKLVRTRLATRTG